VDISDREIWPLNHVHSGHDVQSWSKFIGQLSGRLRLINPPT
jgi:hypothetical protein